MKSSANAPDLAPIIYASMTGGLINREFEPASSFNLVHSDQGGQVMVQSAKLFMNGRGQAVRLPAAFCFAADEGFIRRDAETGEVILSMRPPTWDGFFAALASTDTPGEFLDEKERRQGAQDRDPFADWH